MRGKPYSYIMLVNKHIQQKGKTYIEKKKREYLLEEKNVTQRLSSYGTDWARERKTNLPNALKSF